jgi:hypothetical protein
VFEAFACGVIDTQIHSVAHQKPEHRAAMEQSHTAEHAARHWIERTEQVQDEVLKAGAHAGHQNASEVACTTSGSVRTIDSTSSGTSPSTETRQIASPP